MFIQQMSQEECFKFLARARLGRLACAKDNQPYIVPIYFALDRSALDDVCLYGFTTLGQKTEWMRANPQLCVEVDDVKGRERWESLVIFGTYEELADTGEQAPNHRRAVELLQEHAVWWQPGVATFAAKAQRDGPKPFVPIFYRIKVHEVTGHRCGVPPSAEVADDMATSELRSRGWLRRLLRSMKIALARSPGVWV
jgi:nitroimidazol reductase NimA-like FMN-containing flavoprotein (pyridoxamine 5'-phosphate oxidase superfamily)